MVAATNVGLATMVAEKRFREDLYYRLDVFPIVIPPLRERREDIPALARHFVDRYARRMEKRIETISAAAMTTMTEYHWPGNVRELANVLERAVILSASPVLDREHLGALATVSRGADGPGRHTVSADAMPLAAMEKLAIADALRRANGNKSRAAELLGVTRMQLYTRLKRFGLDRWFRGAAAWCLMTIPPGLACA
jgi:transcriptional regulator with PAS, ATPase and Fis domain